MATSLKGQLIFKITKEKKKKKKFIYASWAKFFQLPDISYPHKIQIKPRVS